MQGMQATRAGTAALPGQRQAQDAGTAARGPHDLGRLVGGGVAAAGLAQVGPVDVGAELLATQGAAGFALQCNHQIGAEALTHGARLAQVTDRRIGTPRKGLLFGHRQRIEVSQQFFHAATLPSSNVPVNTFRCFSLR